jgi:hypothetical protein
VETAVELPSIEGAAEGSHPGNDAAQIDAPLDGLDWSGKSALVSEPGNDIASSSQVGNFSSRGVPAEAMRSLLDWYSEGDSVADIQLSLESPAVVSDQAQISAYSSIQSFQAGHLGKDFDVEQRDLPVLSSWSIGYALMEMHLAKSDDAALGFEMNHFNGLNVAVTGIGLEMAQAMIGAPKFGSDAQTMQTLSGLTEGLAALA